MMNAWLAGLTFSVLVGALGTWLFLLLARMLTKAPKKPESGAKRVSPWLTGVVERAFFTVLVGVNAAGYPTAMVGWLALKLATNWNHPSWQNKPEARTHALLALLAGAVSLLFSVVGGLICNGTISIVT